MHRVLLLGNGISRLLYHRRISEWRGELWICNNAFYEWGHKCTRIAGHVDVMQKAIDYREAHGLQFEVMSSTQRVFNHKIIELTCPPEFRKDTGTTILAQALHDKYEEVHCCGFDLGGKDVTSPSHHNYNKASWVRRWRILATHYGLNRIHFWGADHKSIIESRNGDDEWAYYRRYCDAKAHIEDERFRKLHDALFGSQRWRPKGMLLCEYLRGPNEGYRTRHKIEIAQAYAEAGKVRILDEMPKELIEQDEQSAELRREVAKWLPLKTLRIMAMLRFVSGYETMTKDQLMLAIRRKDK